MGVPVLLYSCLVVRAFNQRTTKPGLVSSSAGVLKAQGNVPHSPAGCPVKREMRFLSPLG